MEAESLTSRWNLLKRYRPCLQYDSQALCRASSAATAAVNPGNQLVRKRSFGRKRILETASGYPQLTLDVLGRYAVEDRAKGSDYLAGAPDRLNDSRELQTNELYRDRIYGGVRLVNDRKRLWYWLWFYYNHSGPTAGLGLGGAESPRGDGAWRTVELELGNDGTPLCVIIDDEVREWETVWKYPSPGADHPVLFVAPFTQRLLFEAKETFGEFGYQSCDGKGLRILPTLEEPALEDPALEEPVAWSRWPGRWGESPTSPKSPRHQAAPELFERLARLSIRGFRFLVRKESSPTRPKVNASLEGDRVVVRPGSDKSTARLIVSVHLGNEPLAAANITKLGRGTEHLIELPSTEPRCTVRMSALSLWGRRSDVAERELNVSDRDELGEQSMFDNVLEAQLLRPEVGRFIDRFGYERKALSQSIRAKTDTLWSKVPSDLQAFRDARTARVRRGEAAQAKRAAAWVGGLLAALAPLPLAGVVLLALAAPNLLAGLWWLALLPFTLVLIVVDQLKRYRSANEELARWTDPGQPEEDATLKRARSSLERALREKAIAPAIREEINEKVRHDYEARLDFGDEGLAELRVRQQEVTTRAKTNLKALTDRMPGGSLGIAGPRGAGKTTLIQAYCDRRDANDRRLTRVVAAPVKYDARDFVLALFGEICHAFLDTPRPRSDRLERRRNWWRWPWWPVLLVLVFAAAVAYLALQVASALWLQLALGVVSLITSVTGAVRAWRQWRASSAVRPEPLEERLRATAVRHLEDIRFQQSYSYGFSGKLALPLGAEAGAEWKQDITEKQATFPEIVARFRSFLADAARARGGVVIGIDEMDKMESTKAAEQFLNEIKGIFGVEDCFFLVSISENAMSSFDRRGLPFRDVFDSSFDEVISVDPLPLQQSKAVLRSRVVGLGPAYLDLCHCLSGGLARDLIRCVRQLSLHKDEKLTIAKASKKLVEVELRRKVDAAIVEAKETSVEPGLSDLLLWLRGLGAPEISAEGMLTQSETRPTNWPPAAGTGGPNAAGDDAERLVDLHVELATFVYYLATVLKLFAEAESRHELPKEPRVFLGKQQRPSAIRI